MLWWTERRLEFIETRLCWEDVVSRAHLTTAFGISPQQASSDFSCYRKLAPNNAVFNRLRKGYVRRTRPTLSSVDHRADRDWHERSRIIFGPHPKLSDGQRKAIEADYSMTGGVSVIDVRRCFLRYFLKRFGLERNADLCRPQNQHVVLLNGDDVLAVLAVERADA